MKTWREIASPIISQVIKDHKDKPQAELKKALFNAYPFGDREYHPYKIWLDEIKIQTGRKKRKVRGEIFNPNQIQLL